MTRRNTIVEREEETMEDRRGAGSLEDASSVLSFDSRRESEEVEHERQQFGVVDCVTWDGH